MIFSTQWLDKDSLSRLRKNTKIISITDITKILGYNHEMEANKRENFIQGPQIESEVEIPLDPGCLFSFVSGH
jgi:hypothetical protein